MKCVVHIFFALLILSPSITSVSVANKEGDDSRGDRQIFKNTSSQPPPPIPPDSGINRSEENVTSRPEKEIEVITKEVTTIPLSTAILILDTIKPTFETKGKNNTDDEGLVVKNGYTSTTESSPLIKISVTSSVSSSIDENNKPEERNNGTVKTHRKPTSRTAQNKLASSKPNRGNSILRRSGASGVCATPYGKMSVGQAIHWIGCRKIICRSERGFPHLLEKTCPPIPTNLPRGCTILHPSQTLPYPSCCPTPSCPPPGPRSPPTLKPANTKTKLKQSQKNSDAIETSTNKTLSVQIAEKKRSVNVYEPDEFSISSNGQEGLINEAENETTSSENERIKLTGAKPANDKLTSVEKERKEFEEISTKPFGDPGQNRYNEGKETKTLLDMLVGRKPSPTTARNASFLLDKKNQTIPTESHRTKRINELLKNTAHHKQVQNKSHEHTNSTVPSARKNSKFSGTINRLSSNNRTDETLSEADPKRYITETQRIQNHTNSSTTDDEDEQDFPFEMPNKAAMKERVTIIKASYNSNVPKSTNVTESDGKNSSSPIISAVSMTKVAIGDSYSNIEKSEHYEYSHETSISSPYEQTNLTNLLNEPDSIEEIISAVPNNSKKPTVLPEIRTTIGVSPTTIPTTTAFSTERNSSEVLKDQISESTSVNVSQEKESESKNKIDGKESNNGGEISKNVRIVETRPKYIKFFSILKNVTGNKNTSTKNKNFEQDSQLPSNLNKRDRITLAMVSEAIEKGLDALLKAPSVEKEPTTQISSNNGMNDLIEFIYIGLNPPSQISHRGNIRYLSTEEDMKSSETKQIERRRRNTKFHKQEENEIDKDLKPRSRPVFYIPWRKRQKQVEAEDKTTEVPDKEKPSNISAQSSTIVESSTAEQAETPVKTASAQETAPLKLEEDPADPKTVSEQTTIEENPKSQNDQNTRAELLAKRRSRSRMTIPGLRLNRNRPTNGTKLNEKLSAFTQTAYARYRKKNTKNDTAKNEQNNSNEEPQQESASTPFRRRRLRSRRIQGDTKEQNDEQEALPTETKPLKNDKISQNSDRNRRMRTIRQRLLGRRKSVGKGSDQNETEEAVDAKNTSETTLSTVDITEPPEVMKKHINVVQTSSDRTVKEVEKQTTTLPVLSVNSVTNEETISKKGENVAVGTESPKPFSRVKSLSARLRLKNRAGLRSRVPSPLPNYIKSTETPIFKILNQEPNKKSLEAQSEQSKDETKAVSLTSESDQTLNAIDNEQKDELKEERTNNRQSLRRRQNLAQREKLLKLIRARARARKLTEPTTSAETTTQTTTLQTTSLKPATPTTSIQLIIPKKVELKRIPVKIIKEKPIIVRAPKTSQPVRQRLRPKPVSAIKPVALKVPSRSLSPVRVKQPQLLNHSTTKAPTVPLVTTSATPVVIPPRRTVQIAVRKPAVNRNSGLSPQHIQNAIVTPKASPRGQKTYSPQRVNQIVTKPQALPIQVHQTHTIIQQPTQPPNQHGQLITRPPQTQRQNFYQIFHHPSPAPPNNQFIAHQNLQRIPVQNQPQNQPQLHRPQQNIVYHPAQVQPTNPPQHHNQVVHSQVQHVPQTTTKKSVDYENLLPTIDDFPEMYDEYKIPSFDFGDEEFEYKEPQFLIDYKKKNEETKEEPGKNKKSPAPGESGFTIPKEPTFTIPKKSKLKKENIPKGAKVTEDEYFIEGPSGVPIKVTTVTFHTSKSSVRNENVKNRSSHFKRDPFVTQ